MNVTGINLTTALSIYANLAELWFSYTTVVFVRLLCIVMYIKSNGKVLFLPTEKLLNVSCCPVTLFPSFIHWNMFCNPSSSGHSVISLYSLNKPHPCSASHLGLFLCLTLIYSPRTCSWTLLIKYFAPDPFAFRSDLSRTRVITRTVIYANATYGPALTVSFAPFVTVPQVAQTRCHVWSQTYGENGWFKYLYSDSQMSEKKAVGSVCALMSSMCRHIF